MFLITVNRQVIKFLLKHLNGREDVVDLSAESPKMLSGFVVTLFCMWTLSP